MGSFFFSRADCVLVLESVLYGYVAQAPDHARLSAKLKDVKDSIWAFRYEVAHERRDELVRIMYFAQFTAEGTGARPWPANQAAASSWIAFRQVNRMCWGAAAANASGTRVPNAFLRIPCPIRIIKLMQSWMRIRDRSGSQHDDNTTAVDSRLWDATMVHIEESLEMLPSGYKNYRLLELRRNMGSPVAKANAYQQRTRNEPRG